MQTYRITPRVCRSTAAAFPSRAISTFFPHFPPTSEISPFFRLLDNRALQYPSGFRHQRFPSHGLLSPRFDVREVAAAFELQGELPGIRQEDVDIEFVDANTLVIRGKTESESTRTSDGASAVSAKGKEAESPDTLVENDDAASAAGKRSSHQATVEDEYVDAGAESDVEGTKSTSTVATEPAETAKEVDTPAAVEGGRDKARYWVSERATGEFERRFKFPGEVDQDAVKASLKNGILSIVVPKVAARKERRILVE